MNILILYEHLVREWDATQKLKKLFEAEGDRVMVASIIFERFKILREVKKYPPEIIFVPWFVGEPHEQMLAPILKITPRARVINLHHEEVCSKASLSLVLPVSRYAKNGSFHFVWGNYFKQILMENGVKESNIVVTGNIRNDAVRAVPPSKAELAAQYGLSEQKQWILFADNRGWLMDRRTRGGDKELATRGLSINKQEEIIARNQANFERMGMQLTKIGTEFTDKFEFIYRPHPGVASLPSLPNWVRVISERSIYDWIMSCDLFLTCESTSIFEAEMCGKPCAIVPEEPEPEEMDKMVGVWRYPKITDLSALNEELIEKVTEMNKQTGTVYADYLGKVDGKAAERVVAAAKGICSVEIDPQDRQYTAATKKQMLRYFLYEKMTWIMTKTNLLPKIKFPKTAFVEMRDIPYAASNSWIHQKNS